MVVQIAELVPNRPVRGTRRLGNGCEVLSHRPGAGSAVRQ
jgi:hypothetical protein